MGSYIESKNIGLLIVDTLRSVHGKNENDSGEMQEIMDYLRAMTVTYGVSIVLLHHTTKRNADGVLREYRGSSVLQGSTDFLLFLTSTRITDSSRLLTLKVLKGRGRRVPPKIHCQLSWDDNSATLMAALAPPVPIEALSISEAIVARLTQGPAFMDELLKAVPNPKQLAAKTLRAKIDTAGEELVSAGVIDRKSVSGKLRWSLVSEIGKAAA